MVWGYYTDIWRAVRSRSIFSRNNTLYLVCNVLYSNIFSLKVCGEIGLAWFMLCLSINSLSLRISACRIALFSVITCNRLCSFESSVTASTTRGSFITLSSAVFLSSSSVCIYSLRLVLLVSSSFSSESNRACFLFTASGFSLLSFLESLSLSRRNCFSLA